MDKNIVFLSTYPPRQCGIATFTEDLVKNLKTLYPLNSYKIIAINDTHYDYGDDVCGVLNQFTKDDYKKLACKLNSSDVDLVVIEHEYGIYGGDTGEYLLDFINNLTIPFITTLHTVLSEPSEKQKYILASIGKRSKRIITMAKNSSDVLKKVYNIPESKIQIVHHGVPNISVKDKDNLKDTLGYKSRCIISTFGLLSPGKGIEYAIESISKVSKKHPEVLYLVLGKTHPCIKNQHGEEYREKLQKMVQNLNIQDNVKFINKYLSKSEIVNYLNLSDIYMTPYLSKEQSVSGTLAYAAGYGKVIVSTPYRYAQEMLNNNRGILAKFRDSNSLYEAVEFLLDNPTERKVMEKNMSRLGLNMRWPNVAGRYENLFSNIIKDNKRKKQVV